MDFIGKNILIVGAARSGISAARLLSRLEANVTLADNKRREDVSDKAICLEGEGVKLLLGRNAERELIKKQSLIIASPGIPLEMETFETAREEGIPIMGEMELAFSLCPCPVAAITGTNGKTTTTAFACEIIKKHIENTWAVGNIGAPFSERVLELKEDSFIVLEASSFQLENISVFKPRISAILNVTPDHLDRHKTFERYLEAKTNIFKYTDNGCVVILNRDDPILSRVTVSTGAEVLYFSAAKRLNEGVFVENEEIILKYNGNESPLINVNELCLPGAHNVQNALAAALIAACAGVPNDIIAKALREFKGVPHRIEFVRELNKVKYFNDSKGTNPDASIKALEAMKGKIILIAGGYDKGSDFGELASHFNEKLSRLIVLGETKEKIIEACEKAGFNNYTKAENYERAVRLASEIALPGENVLLSPACASWDMFEDFEKRGDYFKELVNNL